MRTPMLRFIALLGMLVLAVAPIVAQENSPEALQPVPNALQSAGIKPEIGFRWLDADLLGYMSSCVVRDNLAYCTFTRGLQIIDLSNPASPARVSELPLKSTSGAVLYGDYAYVAASDYDDSLKVISVANPAAPVIVSRLAAPNRAVPSLIYDKYLYVVVNGNTPCPKIEIYDLTDPVHPVLAATWLASMLTTQNTIHTACYEGGYVYAITSDRRIIVLNLADPLSPQVISDTPSSVYVSSIDVEGNLACVVGYSSGLVVYDITDRSAPVQVATYQPVMDTVQLQARQVRLVGTTAYVITESDGIDVVDLSDPIVPQLTLRREPQERYLWNHVAGMVTSGDHLVMRRSNFGMEIIDNSPGTTLATVGVYETKDAPMDVAANGQYLHVACAGTGLRVMDAGNPQNPILVGSYLASNATSIASAGTIVYLGRSSDKLCDIVDVSDPAAPQFVGQLTTAGVLNDLAVRGSALYVIDAATGLQAYDITSPAVPVKAGSISWLGAVRVSVDATRAVVTSGSLGAKFLDLSDPLNPVDMTFWSSDFATHRSAALYGQYAYVFAPWVHVIDLSQSFPFQVNQLDAWMEATDAVLRGSYLWISSNGGVLPYNVSDPKSPEYAFYWGTAYDARGFALADSLVYVCYENGLLTYAIEKCCNGQTGDIDANGVTDLVDLSQLIRFVLVGSYYGNSCRPAFNVNKQGIADLSDLSMMIAYLTGERTSLPACP